MTTTKIEKKKVTAHVKPGELITMAEGLYVTNQPACTISISDAAGLLGLSYKTIWRLVHGKQLKTTKGRHITLGYLVEYLNSSK